MVKTTTLCAWKAFKCLNEAEHAVGDSRYCLMHSYEQRNWIWRWANASMLAQINQERLDKRRARAEREQEALLGPARQAWADVSVEDVSVEMDCGI